MTSETGGAVGPSGPAAPPDEVWLADWSDGEDADFRWAWARAGLSVSVMRSSPMGATVGRPWHRLRSWPAYAHLAFRSRSATSPVIAWQPIAGAMAALAGRATTLTMLSPLFTVGSRSLGQLGLRAGAARTGSVVMFSRRAVDAAVAVGVPASRLHFLPLGVRARPAGEPGTYFLALGRDGRDWRVLTEATAGTGLDVRAIGPHPAQRLGEVTVLPATDRAGVRRCIEGAAAVVVPLLRPDRTAGQLAVLDAFASGRGVIATRAQGTEDYVSHDNGILVPVGDATALRRALLDVGDPPRAAELGAGARRSTAGPLALERFVRDVHGVAAR